MIIFELTRFCYPLTLLDRWELLPQDSLDTQLAKVGLQFIFFLLVASLALVRFLFSILVFVIFVTLTALSLSLLVLISQKLIRLRAR